LPPSPMESIGGETITVSSFRFAGNALLGEGELSTAVAPFVGRPLDFAGLQNAALAVANAYRERGWLVRAYLPQQEIETGVVTIGSVEPTFGAVGAEGASTTRTPEARLRRIVESAQAPGEPLSAAALDRGLLLINDLPGVSAKGRLAAGAS